MSDPINANPTILNASDLPTRRNLSASETDKSSASGIFAKTSPPLYSLDPFLPKPILLRPSSPGSSSNLSTSDDDNDDENSVEEIDAQEIYDLISTISDPEHPLSLGSLAVVNLPDISITPTLASNPSSPLRTVTVLITPTITHCSLATVIGLGVRVRLEQALPPRFRVDVKIKEGTHSTAESVTKQLGDKERVAAAVENGTLMGVIRRMLETCQ